MITHGINIPSPFYCMLYVRYNFRYLLQKCCLWPEKQRENRSTLYFCSGLGQGFKHSVQAYKRRISLQRDFVISPLCHEIQEWGTQAKTNGYEKLVAVINVVVAVMASGRSQQSLCEEWIGEKFLSQIKTSQSSWYIWILLWFPIIISLIIGCLFCFQTLL